MKETNIKVSYWYGKVMELGWNGWVKTSEVKVISDIVSKRATGR